MNKNRKNVEEKGDIIIQSCAGIVLPIALMLGAYIIIHGHLTPGGGFQGGVLIGGAVAIMYIAFGGDGVKKAFHLNRLKASESIAALGFILVASLGVVYGFGGYHFFENVVSKGNPGYVLSSGSIFLMNFAVGYKVLAGIGALIFIMLSTLNKSEE